MALQPPTVDGTTSRVGAVGPGAFGGGGEEAKVKGEGRDIRWEQWRKAASDGGMEEAGCGEETRSERVTVEQRQRSGEELAAVGELGVVGKATAGRRSRREDPGHRMRTDWAEKMGKSSIRCVVVFVATPRWSPPCVAPVGFIRLPSFCLLCHCPSPTPFLSASAFCKLAFAAATAPGPFQPCRSPADPLEVNRCHTLWSRSLRREGGIFYILRSERKHLCCAAHSHLRAHRRLVGLALAFIVGVQDGG